MKSLWKAVIWILFGLSVAAQTRLAHAQEAEPTPSQEQRLEELDQKVRVLERKWELDQEAAQAKAKEASPIKVSGVIQLDYRGFPGSPSQSSPDGFLMRRVRPSVEGKIQNRLEFKIVPEFGEGKASLQDAYGDLILGSGLKLRLGKAKVPFGLERLQSDPVLPFMERSLATDLAPDRDLGLQALADLADGKVQAAIGVFNGVADGASADLETDRTKDVAARLFWQPSSSLGFGGALTYGEPTGNTSSTGLTSGYKTEGQKTFFVYGYSVVNRERRFRSSAQAYLNGGPLGLEVEFIRSSQDVQSFSYYALTQRGILNHEAWQVTASIALTGEGESYKGLKVRESFDPSKGGWGGLELVLRASALTLDPDTFPQFAYTGSSASSAQAWTLGLNWILGPNLKVYLDYGATSFDGGSPIFSKNREDEKLLFSRFQTTY